MQNNKCQIASHDSRKIITICFDTKCKMRRLCCQMCLNDFHKDHFDQLVDLDYLLNYIKTENQKASVPFLQASQAMQELTKVESCLEQLSQKIQLELERLSSYSLQSICKKIGNKYDILKDEFQELDTQAQKNLAQDMLQYFEVKNGKFKEKCYPINQFGQPYSQFLKEFSKGMSNIVKEFKLIDQILVNNEKNINLKNFAKFTQSQILQGEEEGVRGIDICEQRNLIMSGGRDKTVKLWNLKDNTLIKTYSHSGPVYDVAFSKKGNLIVFGGKGDYSIKVIDISDFKKDVIQELHGHKKQIYRLKFCSDRYLISGSEDRTVKIWDIESNKEIHSLISESAVKGVAVGFDDSLIASNSWNGTIQIWDAKSNFNILCQHQTYSHGTGVQFSHDHNSLVTGDYAGVIKLWSLRELNQNKLSLIREFKLGNNCIWTVIFSPCSRYIITVCNRDSEIKITDSQTGLLEQQFYSVQTKKYKIADVVISNTMDMIAYGQDSSIVIWKKK